MAKHKAGQHKQVNKAFKGSSKRKSSQKSSNLLKKTIQKQEAKTVRPPKQTCIVERPLPVDNSKKYEIDIRRTKKPRIIALIPFNESANAYQLKQQIMTHFKLTEEPIISYQSQQLFLNVPQSKVVKSPLQFIFLDRDLNSTIDACKVADIICPLLSCRDCSVDKITLDPYSNAKAFDGFGYKILSNLRAQGLLPQVCVIQDLDTVVKPKQNQVKKLFSRYFESEFVNPHVVGIESADSIGNLVRSILSINEVGYEWRDQRGYMLPEDVIQVNGEVALQGIWRGTTGISANQLIHITGIDDFEILRIELVRQMEEGDILHRNERDAEVLDPFCQSKDTQDIGDMLKEIENLGIVEEPQQQQEMEIDENDSDVSCDEQENEEDLEAEKKRRQAYEITQRAPEDMDYEDEVDYGMDVKLRERYSKFYGLKNMRSADFDPLTFLPDEVDKIYNLRFLKKVKADVLSDAALREQLPPGLRIKIYIKNPTEDLVAKLTTVNRVLVVSGLLKHERKMTQMHVKIHRHPQCDIKLKNKENINVQIGFRRAIVNPIYSRILSNSNKSKFVKEVNDDNFYLCSFYFLTTFPPQQVLIWNNDFDQRNAVLLATGEIMRCDAFQIILKRVILTGYPFKINKRKAVIRLMFYNPEDIRYFHPIELTTKHGLKGNIVEPLGTHGLLKCRFNDFIRPNDTISMSLYKRVHPRFPKLM